MSVCSGSFLLVFFSLPNKAAARSRSIPSLPQFYLTLVHGVECEVEGWTRLGRGSYAGTVRPDPWRRAALAAIAPTALPPSSSLNKFDLCPLLLLVFSDSAMVVGGNANGATEMNRLSQVRVAPDLEELQPLLFLHFRHFGGDMIEDERWNTGVQCLGSSSFPPVFLLKLRLRSSTRRWPFWPNGGLVIPLGHDCQGLLRSRVRGVLLRRDPHIGRPWWLHRTKWFVPSVGAIGSGLESVWTQL